MHIYIYISIFMHIYIYISHPSQCSSFEHMRKHCPTRQVCLLLLLLLNFVLLFCFLFCNIVAEADGGLPRLAAAARAGRPRPRGPPAQTTRGRPAAARWGDRGRRRCPCPCHRRCPCPCRCHRPPRRCRRRCPTLDSMGAYGCGDGPPRYAIIVSSLLEG